jgi:hypothetical protein
MLQAFRRQDGLFQFLLKAQQLIQLGYKCQQRIELLTTFGTTLRREHKFLYS